MNNFWCWFPFFIHLHRYDLILIKYLLINSSTGPKINKEIHVTKMRQKWEKLFNKIYTVTVQGVKTTRTTVRLPVGTKKNIPSNFDVIGTLGRYIISCWVLRAACFYTYSNEVMYAQQFSMMMNKMNQSRRENVKVDIKLEKCISTSNPTFLTTAVHSICAYLSFCLWARLT